jgi:MFS family permease
MKIDLVGPSRRGLALGLNEAAGYLSVAAAAYLAGVIAESHGLRPAPFYLGIAFAAVGLALSACFARDTGGHMRAEAGANTASASLRRAFAEATWRRPRLVSLTQAGFVNNLNDGLAWGIFPLFFAASGLSIARIGLLAASYPFAWGGLQLITGWTSDIVGRTPLIVAGMLIQGVALAVVGVGDSFRIWLIALGLLGLGTAMVYPTLLASIGDLVRPTDRATTLGVYRFWRDGGAMVGALFGGAVADLFGFKLAIVLVAVLTAASGIVVLAIALTNRGRFGQEVTA